MASPKASPISCDDYQSSSARKGLALSRSPLGCRRRKNLVAKKIKLDGLDSIAVGQLWQQLTEDYGMREAQVFKPERTVRT
jgi:hypothetical protein